MNFDDMYPGAEAYWQPPSGAYLIMKCTEARPCWHCGSPTHWVELCFEAPLCSEKCERAKWIEYRLACRESQARGIAQWIGPDWQRFTDEV